MHIRLYLLMVFFVLFLQGCAHSSVSREAAGQMDVGVKSANALVDSAGNGGIAEAYQNTSQTTKGVLFGGAAGAAVGSLTSGVGILPGLAGGAILGGAFGAYLDSYTTIRDQLENRNAQVIVLGDQLLIVLPSQHIFYGMTPNIRPQSYSTLHLVTKLVKDYPNIMVKVSAYTDAIGPQRIDQALSQQQADNVAKFLWRDGINTRMLYSQGYGGCKLVAPNTLDAGSSSNYRIEITLEKVPV